jgi:hypothetical protein
MKYLLEVEGQKLAFESEDFEGLVKILSKATRFKEAHVGERNGTHGYKNAYMYEPSDAVLHDWLKVTPMTDEFFSALFLVRSLQEKSDE